MAGLSAFAGLGQAARPMRIGVFGGTFDPPHVGHLILAEACREQLALDRVLFIPAGDPWRKTDREVTRASHRLAMTRLAVAGNEAFAIDDCEVTREGPSYSIDTLRLLHDRLPVGHELLLIIGEDALADLPNWREPAALAALATIAVVPREGVKLPALPFDHDRIVEVAMPYIGISSTALRERVRAGLSIRYQTPPAVEAYIREQGLYNAVA
jgi:nicotinate-nucleotide adenylyltransferase